MTELDAIFARASDDDAQDAVDALITPQTWPAVRDHVLGVLDDPARTPEQWYLAAAVVWGACLDERPLPTDRAIALVYARLSEDQENLAWSIAVKLKHVSYLSDYDPRRDPNIVLELARVRR